MPTNGPRSQRIIVLGDQQPSYDAAPAPAQRPASTRSRLPAPQTGWTARRLTIGGALGACALLAGGLLFTSKFGAKGAAASPFLAIGFGLFAIGMLVFCSCLIALIGTGLIALSERRGWTPAALAVLTPLAFVWALWMLGSVGYAIPAVLSLVLIGGLMVALK
jgi:hypothetical protein